MNPGWMMGIGLVLVALGFCAFAGIEPGGDTNGLWAALGAVLLLAGIVLGTVGAFAADHRHASNLARNRELVARQLGVSTDDIRVLDRTTNKFMARAQDGRGLICIVASDVVSCSGGDGR